MNAWVAAPMVSDVVLTDVVPAESAFEAMADSINVNSSRISSGIYFVASSGTPVAV